jgi:hypothetical protein
MSFTASLFQVSDTSESAEPVSSVFKENVSELVQIINLQTSLKRGVKDTDF